MKTVFLTGSDLEQDKQMLSDIKDANAIFVLTGPQPLYQYIEELRINNRLSYQKRICKELTGLDVDYTLGDSVTHVSCFSELLEALDASCVSYVMVKGDTTGDEERNAAVRTQLSDIVQQIIYLGLPLEKIQVVTEREFQDIQKVMRFEAGITELQDMVKEAQEKLQSVDYQEYTDIQKTVKRSMETISDCLQDATASELKIAVAASKKSGKSVIVNSMIKCELAPTSLELATPNNCIYRRSGKENTYTLSYGPNYLEYQDPLKMREQILQMFKNAQMDSAHGYAIRDMNIGYVSGEQGFSSYTIYDTPGPDLAGAVGHKEAAERAIHEADVIVFSIDYSKYLVDSEYKYLEMIREVCKSKKKFYSLILCVNKLDLRYDSEGVKSVPRILDFIREKLISIDPGFRDCIVMGTSALTYFNCLKAVTMPDCQCLGDAEGFSSNLQDCIDHYLDIEDEGRGDSTDEEMTTLSFLYKMSSNMKNFHGVKVIESIEELKQSSGMPNFLSYVAYIARSKARTERVNNLMHHIDAAKCEIQNLFHFQELEEALAKNQDQLEQAKAILDKFSTRVREIYDPTYPDLCQEVREGLCKSQKIKEVAGGERFSTQELRNQFENEVNGTLDEHTMIDDITKGAVKKQLNDKLKNVHAASQKKEYIEGASRTIVYTDDNIRCVGEVSDNLGDTTANYITTQIELYVSDLMTEQKVIQNDLTNVLNQRSKWLKEAIADCQRSLGEQCGVEFSLEAPSFSFAFKQAEDHKEANLNIDSKSFKEITRAILNQYTETGEVGIDASLSFLDMFKAAIRLIFKQNVDFLRICYDQDYLMNTVYEEDMRYQFKALLEKANINEIYQPYKQDIMDQISDFITDIENELKVQRDHAIAIADQARGTIDHTTEYANAIRKLEQKRGVLENVSECVSHFCDHWNQSILINSEG